MWLGHDKGWWGLALGIAAIALTIPLSIVANFITPVLRNKLATWSQSSLHARIAKLASDFARLEKDCPLMTATEDQMLQGVICIAKLLSFGINMFGITAFMVAKFADSPAITFDMRFFLYVIAVGCYLLPGVWRRSTINGLVKYRADHSEKIRNAYRKNLEELKDIAANW